MKKQIIDYHELVIEQGRPAKDYYDQFETVKSLEVGGKYKNNVGSFMETVYTIVYIGHGVALGIEDKKPDGYAPSKMLFHSEGMMIGWRISAPRPSYRLRDI